MSKKTTLLATVFCCALFAACTPEPIQDENTGDTSSLAFTAQWLPGNTKGGPVIGITLRAGHKKENCDGSCSQRKEAHKDCQGSGQECSQVGSLELHPMFPKAIHSTTPSHYTAYCLYPEDISDEETFAMPDRSLYIVSDGQWLNIPQQTLHRAPETHCFIINNLAVTGQALYKKQ